VTYALVMPVPKELTKEGTQELSRRLQMWLSGLSKPVSMSSRATAPTDIFCNLSSPAPSVVECGGSFENRIWFMLEVVDAIQAATLL